MGLSSAEAARFGKVAVLMGGWSAEREISLKSGAAVLAALKAADIDAAAIDCDAGVLESLEAGEFARAFVALHGRGGEDGVIQGALEILGLPYTGSGVLGSALAMDKLRSKRLWIGMGLPTPDFRLLISAADQQEVIDGLGLPLIIKPALEGSSIGMTCVDEPDRFAGAYATAAHYGGPILAEQWVTGAEYTIALVDDEILPAIRLETPHRFYDFEAKYEADDTRYHCPSGLPPTREAELGQLARRAFEACGASGWGRVDLFVDESDRAWLLEVNTVPGMTDHSLVPMAANARGIDFGSLVIRILATADVDTK